MSGDAATPTTAPSTADIAADVVEQYEATESTESAAVDTSTDIPGAETSTEAPAVEAKADPTPAVIEPAASPAAKFLEEQGHRAKKSDGRPNWLPVKSVEGMLARFAEQQLGEHQTTSKSLTEERDRYRADLDELYTDVRGEPKAFLEKLSQADPRYRAFLEPAAAQASTAAAPVLDMPTPDVPLPDGSKTYSVDGIQKLIEWAVDAKMLPKVDERLKPWADRDKAEKDRIATERTQAAVRERAQKQVSEAQTWPLFGKLEEGKYTPFQQKVFDTLKADKALDLRGAYIKVANERYVESDTEKRERWIKEQNATAAKTPTVARTDGGAPKVGPASTHEIAARTIARLESGG